MTSPSPTLVRAAGASYFPIALVARLPYAMMVVGVLTLVVAARDSIALAGVNSAVVGLGAATVGPFVGAAADRLGQRRVLLVASLVSTAALGLLAWVAHSPLPDGALLAVAFLVGASAPQVAPMSRSRLVEIIGARIAPARRSRTFDATMAYESAADEMVFIVGPVLVGVLGTLLDPWAPVVAAAVVTLVFVSAFALHPSATLVHAGPRHDVVRAPVRELLRAELVVVVAGIGAVGLFFGATLTALTAWMADAGRPGAAGLAYGAMGVGSAALALGVVLLPARFTLAARWPVFAGALLAGTALLPLAGSVTAMVTALLVVGVGVGPTLVTLYSLGALRSPAGRSATVMTMLGSAVIVGQSAASALTGLVAERVGTSAAMLAPVIAAALVMLAAVAHLRLSAARRSRIVRSPALRLRRAASANPAAAPAWSPARSSRSARTLGTSGESPSASAGTASSTASPADGPNARPWATARLTSTTGPGAAPDNRS